MPTIKFTNAMAEPIFVHCLLGPASVACDDRIHQRNLYLHPGDAHEESVAGNTTICFAYGLEDVAYNDLYRCIAEPRDRIILDGSHSCFVDRNLSRPILEEWNPFWRCQMGREDEEGPTNRAAVAGVLSALVMVSEIYRNIQQANNAADIKDCLTNIQAAVDRVEARLVKLSQQMTEILSFLRELPELIRGIVDDSLIRQAVGKIGGYSAAIHNFTNAGGPSNQLADLKQALKAIHVETMGIAKLGGTSGGMVSSPYFGLWLGGMIAYVKAHRLHYPSEVIPDTFDLHEVIQAKRLMIDLYGNAETDKRNYQVRLPNIPENSEWRNPAMYRYSGNFRYVGDTPQNGLFMVTCRRVGDPEKLMQYDRLNSTFNEITDGAAFDAWRAAVEFRSKALALRDLVRQLLPVKTRVLSSYDRPPLDP